MEKSNNNLLEAAKKYLSMGFSVIPVGEGKMPIIQWKEFQTRKATEAELADWFYNPKVIGVGIVTGQISGIVVLDTERGADFTGLKIPNTPTAISGGGGAHYYFRYKKEDGITNSVKFLPSMDTRGEGGFIIAPPSLHTSGRHYEWAEGLSPTEIKLASAPKWLKDKIQEKKSESTDKNWPEILKGVGVGGRNETAASIAGKFLGELSVNEWESVAWPALRGWNLQCTPPLPETELRATFKSIARKENKHKKMPEKQILENQQREKKLMRYKLKTPSNKVSFEEWEKTIKENFPEFAFIARAGISVIAQLLIKDVTNPFGLVYADVPSSGKTIVLNFFSDSDIAYITDSFTPASFVSQAANVSAMDLLKVDLLPKIQFKTMIVRDLAPMFGLRGDDLTKNMGILTRVFDGDGLFIEGGVHGHRGYKGDYLFMFLAASTPISPRLWKLMGSMGSRLYFLNVNSKDKSEKELSQQIMGKNFREKEKFCRAKTTDFIASLWEKHSGGIEWDKQKDDQAAVVLISRAAMLLAKLRGVVSVWEKGNSEVFEYEPAVIEKPDRINQNLYNLARGHAAMRGSESVGMEDIPLILQVALNSTAPTRAKLFRILLDNGGKLKSSMVMDSLKCSRQTALKGMQTLAALEIATYDFDLREHKIWPPENGEPSDFTITIKPEFSWFLGDEFNNLMDRNTVSDKIN